MSGMKQMFRYFCHWALTWGFKRLINLAKHEIDFADMEPLFSNTWVFHGDAKQGQDGEKRESAIGYVDGRLLTVIFTRRDGKLRLISARRASKNERKQYAQATAGHDKLGGAGRDD